MGRERLDKIVVERGLAPSRERARALILGGKVTVGGQVVSKAGELIDGAAEVALREEDHPYVSRGALKLVKAFETWDIEVEGRTAVDVGASTGGFTDLLLRRGARRVYAIDVGYGQLDWKLRSDPRVVVIERENVRHMPRERVPEAVDLAVCDVSFISLTLVLPKIRELLGDAGKPAVVLVKPQFEVGKGEVGRGGVVRDPDKRRAALDKVIAAAEREGFAPVGHVDSPIAGPAGNLEVLLHLRTA